MEAYTDFAEVYDELMDDTPYEEWCGFLMEVFRRYGVDDVSKDAPERGACAKNWKVMPESEDCAKNDVSVTNVNLQQERNTVLDLGCGTGTLTELLAREGFDMIGVDNAEEMLRIAMEKRERSGLDILYLLQDMRELELYGTVGAVVSVCDSLNYLLAEEDIVQTFSRVNDYLYPQGIFVFDFNTVYKYRTVIGNATIAENREDCSFIWENYYHEEQEINEYDLTVFVAEERAGAGVNGMTDRTDADAERRGACGQTAGAAEQSVCGRLEPQRFRRFQEVHYQRGYRLSQMQALLQRAGLEFLEALDADTHGEVTEESGRIYVLARKGAGTTANQAIVPDER